MTWVYVGDTGSREGHGRASRPLAVPRHEDTGHDVT